jgi:hypothetical protein
VVAVAVAAVAVAPAVVGLAIEVVEFASEFVCAGTNREKRVRDKIAAVEKKIRTGRYTIPPRSREA